MRYIALTSKAYVSLSALCAAQNNGVIALTNVASRHAGYAGAGWLFLFGLIGKFGGLVLSIPQCVLGGATSFLFACVLVAGIKVSCYCAHVFEYRMSSCTSVTCNVPAAAALRRIAIKKVPKCWHCLACQNS
jgi:xanthine/uracil permease